MLHHHLTMLQHQPLARHNVQHIHASRIRAVADAAAHRADLLPFWFGEPDQVTAPFIRDAAKAALDAGDTFYTPNLGIPALRQAIADYLTRRHAPIGAERIAITSGGISSLMLAAQLVIEAGDRVVAVTPLWPNLVEIPRVLGAQVDTVALHLDAQQGWTLDLDALLTALTPGTRAVLVNSPNNPTGWVMPPDQQDALLAHCRQHGIWLIADDVYERLVFDRSADTPPQAHSWLARCTPDDRLISVHSFSKSWQMTGWRLGWMVVPERLSADLAKLIEFNTCCAPGFVQRAAVTAISDGEPLVEQFVQRLATARDYLHSALSTMDGLTVSKPQGAMYLFFHMAAAADSLAFCKDLVQATGLGLAPGRAFGPEGESCLRWCFASNTQRLADGVQRFQHFLHGRR